MTKKVSIKDVATYCGISTATVSRVVHDYPYIQDTLRSKVKDAMSRLGYIPVQRNHQKNIVVIIPSSAYSYYISSMIDALSDEIHRHSFIPEIIREKDIDFVKKNSVVGAIMLPYSPGLEKNWNKKYEIPLVTINTDTNETENVYSIVSDDYQCLQLAIDYLYNCGHRRIAFLNHLGTNNINDINRLNAYKKELARHYLPFDEKLVIPLIDNELPELLGQMLWAKPTALICCGESHGLRVSYLLHLMNRKIPDDISLLTFEQNGISAYAIPPHSTLNQDFKTIATHAVNMIINRPINKKILVPYKLLKRQSVGKI